MGKDKTTSAVAEFEAFTKTAFLNVFLPKSAGFDAFSLLREGSPEELQKAPTRKHLFFDERTKLQIVLKAARSKDELKDLLQDLELTIAAHATNAVPEGSGNAASASGKHDVVSIKISASQDVEVAAVGDYTYAVWKPTLHLVRPKARLQRPAIYFTANLGPIVEDAATTKRMEKDYLPSYEPLPANVLEPLQHDPSHASGGRDLYLPETRVTKVSPSAARTEDPVRPLRGATKRAFPAVPALFTRLRYSALPDAMIASLQLETSQLIAGDVSINEVSLEVPDVKIESLNQAVWPQQTHAGDEVVLLYRLTRQPATTSSGTQPMETATVSLKAIAFLEQGSRIELETQWQAQVDVPHLTTATSYKWSRPLSASLGAHRRILSQESARPPSTETSRMQSKEGEVIFTFTSPPTPTVGSDFSLQVQCVNKSTRSRRFALIITEPRSEQSSAKDVQILTPDVRIGPLTSGASYESSLKYRAVKAGILNLGIIRIVDLESRQTLEVAELPDVIARSEESRSSPASSDSD